MIRIDTPYLQTLGYFVGDPRNLRTYQYLMDLGKLPDEVTDETILPQVASAIRQTDLEIRRGVSEEELENLEKDPNVIEAVACYAMSKLIPVLGLFYSDGAANVSREIAEMDYRYYSGNEVIQLSKQWEQRGIQALSRIQHGSDDYVNAILI